MLTNIIENRATQAYKAAWQAPRWAYRHSAGALVQVLSPVVSAAIEAGARVFRLDKEGVVGSINVTRTHLHVDGNTHELVRLSHIAPCDIRVQAGQHSEHLDIDAFLTEIELASGIDAARIYVNIERTGHVEVSIAPSTAWVDPLIRLDIPTASRTQEFVNKYKIGGVPNQVLARLFGEAHYTQCEHGSCAPLAPFCARVQVWIDSYSVYARYCHTIAEVIDFFPGVPLYFCGVKLERCSACLWTLSPWQHGCIHLYTSITPENYAMPLSKCA